MNKIFIFGLMSGILFLGDTPTKDIAVFLPSAESNISYEQGNLLVVSASKEIGRELMVSTQWETEKLIEIGTKSAKDNFAKVFYKIFEPQTNIQLLSYAYQFNSGFTKPESLWFKYSDTMTIRQFWQRTEFADLLKKVQATNAYMMIVYVKGWHDSTYTAKFDDPKNKGRYLYKINLQMIPGENKIYISSFNKKDKAEEYTSTYLNKSKAIESRDGRFHYSVIEKSCTPCHDGLPSADSGKTMKADCSVCHKAIVSGSHAHTPAESKDCLLCHEWSVEKKAMIVTKSVPEVCYDCHSEKKDQAEKSPVLHPVATDCMVCHSPHSSNQSKFLKKDVYRLCLGCHETHRSNHPVDKHPVRFAKIAGSDNSEISCVSCHNPHGSQNASLLKAGGGSMAICMQCHQK